MDICGFLQKYSAQTSLIYRPDLPFFPTAKEYGQTIKDTAKYMHEKKLCLETVPTTDCHVVLTFPKKTDIATLSWIEGILKENLPDLTVHKRLHPYTNMTGWYLTASFDR